MGSQYPALNQLTCEQLHCVMGKHVNLIKIYTE